MRLHVRSLLQAYASLTQAVILLRAAPRQLP
jgi:hypothetical protein